MNKRSIVFVGSGALCVVGVISAAVALFPPGSARNLPTSETDSVALSGGEDRIARPEQFELQPTAGTLAVAVEALAERSGKLMLADSSTGALGAVAASSLANELRQALPPFLSGSFESYREYATSRGAHVPQAAHDVDPWEAFERTWLATGESVALRPMSAEGMIVRLRWKDGLAVVHPKSGAIVETTVAGDRFDVPRDAARDKLTIVEVMIPVMFFHPPRTVGPAYWSIWLAWSPASQSWKIWQFQFYDVDRVGGMYGPVY